MSESSKRISEETGGVDEEADTQQENWVESNGLENEGSYPQCILGCCSDREEGVSVKWF